MCSEVDNGKFIVYSDYPCNFYWHVHGKRLDVETEPDIHDVKIKGDGPYRWI